MGTGILKAKSGQAGQARPGPGCIIRLSCCRGLSLGAAAASRVKTGGAYELHDDEATILRLADLVNGDNVGMVERGGGAGLALEALDGAWVLESVLGQKLQRYQTVEPRILSAINFTLPPRPSSAVI